MFDPSLDRWSMQINPVSGMVINITDLKKTLQTAVMDPCDHRNLVRSHSLVDNRLFRRHFM